MKRIFLLRRRASWVVAALLGSLSSACEGTPLCMEDEYDVELLELRRGGSRDPECLPDLEVPRALSIRPGDPGEPRDAGICQHLGIEYIEPLGELDRGGVGTAPPEGFEWAGNLRPTARRTVNDCEVAVNASLYFSSRYTTVEEAYEGSLAGDQGAFRWGYGISSRDCPWLNAKVGDIYCWNFYRAKLKKR